MFIKTHSIENSCYYTVKIHCWQAPPCIFLAGILQAGAVKGLNSFFPHLNGNGNQLSLLLLIASIWSYSQLASRLTELACDST